MIINIVRMQNGNPDPQQIVARADIGKEGVQLDVFEPSLHDDLQNLFTQPLPRFGPGGAMPGGQSIDAVSTFKPWEPEGLKLIPPRLTTMGLGYTVPDKK